MNDTAPKLVTLPIRVPPEIKAWHAGLRSRAGYEGSDLTRCVLQLVRDACGDDVPVYPFDLDVTVRLRDSGKAVNITSKGTPAAAPKPYHLPDDTPVAKAAERQPDFAHPEDTAVDSRYADLLNRASHGDLAAREELDAINEGTRRTAGSPPVKAPPKDEGIRLEPAMMSLLARARDGDKDAKREIQRIIKGPRPAGATSATRPPIHSSGAHPVAIPPAGASPSVPRKTRQAAKA